MSSYIIQNARVFDPDLGFEVRDVHITRGLFTDTAAPDAAPVDARGLFAIPGLVDIHVHGCAGYDFCDADDAQIAAMLRYQARHGITAVCPTTMSLPEDALTAAVRAISAVCAPDGARVAGIHLEGPFLSPGKAGAQASDYMRAPNIDLFRRLQSACGGLIRLCDIAPELPGAQAFIDALRDEVVCSLAHTEADYDTAMAAFACGARHVTHLFNAMPPFLHRAPGVIGAAFDTRESTSELICDGVHIHPAAVRAALAMLGRERVVFVSDGTAAAGMGNGRFTLGGRAVELHGRTARLAGSDTLAGSACNLYDCVRVAVDIGISLHDALYCAAVSPARVIGAYERIGSIAPGKCADLILLDERLDIRRIWLRGAPLAG